MLIDRFLKYISFECNLSKLTAKAYETDLRQFAQFLATAGDGIEIAKAGQANVRAWVMWLSRHGETQSTVRRKIQALRAFYKWLLQRGSIEKSPVANLELARLPKRLPCFMREPTMNMVLDRPIDDNDFEAVRNRLMLLMLYLTGMRRAELIGLLDSNVDTTICQLKVHGKRDKERIIPFGDELAASIARYRRLREEQVGKGADSFFVTAAGRPVYASLVYRVVHEALEQAGATGKLSPHVLRHSFASSMLNHGAELNAVKELLGHESLAATQVYTHVTFSELKHSYKLAHPRALKKKEANHGS